MVQEPPLKQHFALPVFDSTEICPTMSRACPGIGAQQFLHQLKIQRENTNMATIAASWCWRAVHICASTSLRVSSTSLLNDVMTAMYHSGWLEGLTVSDTAQTYSAVPTPLQVIESATFKRKLQNGQKSVLQNQSF